MTDTLVLNPVFGFEELREHELVAVDGGNINWNAVSQMLAQAQAYATAHSAQLQTAGRNAMAASLTALACRATPGQAALGGVVTFVFTYTP
jgi:hypothetical protein